MAAAMAQAEEERKMWELAGARGSQAEDHLLDGSAASCLGRNLFGSNGS
jgi:hypothetical protein